MKGYFRGLSRGSASQQEVLRLRRRINDTFTVTDPGAANAWFTRPALALPKGKFLLLGARFQFTLTGLDANTITTFGGNISLGSAATADATLNASEIDIIASTALAAAVAKVSTNDFNSTPTEHAKFIDNTAGTKVVNVNGFIADASISANASMNLTGVLDIAAMLF